MKFTLEKLLVNGPVVSDGGWGTRLQSMGLQPGANADIWNLEFPQRVEQVAREYVEAGSQIILTNTFRANRISLSEFGLADKTVEINRAGVNISRQAAGEEILVFASVGPSGKLLMLGDVTERQLAEAFREQAGALVEAGANAIVIETMSDLTEAKIALEAAKATGLPVVVSMVYDSGPDKAHTMMGVTPEQAARELTAEGANAIGANCGQGIEGFPAICGKIRTATHLPIWIKPNAGLPVYEDGKTVYHTSARDFVRFIPGLLKNGADIIGGCCGTSPDFIREIFRVVASPE